MALRSLYSSVPSNISQPEEQPIVGTMLEHPALPPVLPFLLSHSRHGPYQLWVSTLHIRIAWETCKTLDAQTVSQTSVIKI